MIQQALLTWNYTDTETNLIMPWYTLPCLQWLKEQPLEPCRVFEFGAGYSSIWWKANCEIVDSVETNQRWARASDAMWCASKEAYLGACNVEYDVIVVDGDWREESLQVAMKQLSKNGFIIVDNWRDEDFPQDIIDRFDFSEWSLREFKQPNHSTWCTTLLFRK